MDAGNILKPALARGELQLVGATTLNEYRIIEKDAALERRMQPVKVDEPTVEETINYPERYSKEIRRLPPRSLYRCCYRSGCYSSNRYIQDRFCRTRLLTS